MLVLRQNKASGKYEPVTEDGTLVSCPKCGRTFAWRGWRCEAYDATTRDRKCGTRLETNEEGR